MIVLIHFPGSIFSLKMKFFMQLLTDDKSGGASLCFARRFTNVSAERYKHLQSATAILILRSIGRFLQVRMKCKMK